MNPCFKSHYLECAVMRSQILDMESSRVWLCPVPWTGTLSGCSRWPNPALLRVRLQEPQTHTATRHAGSDREGGVSLQLLTGQLGSEGVSLGANYASISRFPAIFMLPWRQLFSEELWFGIVYLSVRMHTSAAKYCFVRKKVNKKMNGHFNTTYYLIA